MAVSATRVSLYYGFGGPVLLLTAMAAVGIGGAYIPWGTILQVLAAKLIAAAWVDAASLTKADAVIVWMIRLPRAMPAVRVAVGLALAGAVMQGLFRNPRFTKCDLVASNRVSKTYRASARLYGQGGHGLRCSARCLGRRARPGGPGVPL